MKTTKLLAGILLAAALTAPSSVFAQVKIGANPTTISANSNLEVEAANNKKIIVNKSDGTVIIENTPVGASSDSILTVSPSGLVRRIGSSTLRQNIGVSGAFRAARNSSNQTLGPSSNAVMVFDTENYDENNELDPVSGVFTVSQTGTWTLYSKEDFSVNTNSNSTALWLQISTDGGVTWRFVASDGKNSVPAGGPYTLNISYTDYLTAGTKVRNLSVTCTGCTTSSYVFSNQSFIGTRIH